MHSYHSSKCLKHASDCYTICWGKVKRNRYIALSFDRHLQCMYTQAAVGTRCMSFYSNCCVGGQRGTGRSIHQQKHSESPQVFLLLLKVVESRGKAFWDFLLVSN